MRHKVVSAARRARTELKQTYAQEGKTLRRKVGGMLAAATWESVKLRSDEQCRRATVAAAGDTDEVTAATRNGHPTLRIELTR